MQRIADRLQSFPGYTQVRRVHVCESLWTAGNGLLTPTQQLRRSQIEEHTTVLSGAIANPLNQ